MTSHRFIHEIKNECTKTTFIILCANKSSRRGNKNVPFTIIDKKYLIDIQISTINSCHTNNEIILISGFENNKLVNYIHEKKYQNVRVVENANFKNSNTLDGWRIGLNACLNSDIYIIHGDRIFSKDNIKKIKSIGTHLVTHNSSKNNYNLGILHDNGLLVNISYGLPDVWSEIFFIHSRDFDFVRKTINNLKPNKIYNIEGYINFLSETIKVSVIKKKTNSVKTLKEIK